MKLTEIELLTNSLVETEHFYKEIFGFKRIAKAEKQCSFQMGSSILHFLESDKIENPVYHVAFDIPENQLLEALEWVGKRAEIIPFQGQPIIDFSNWHAKSFYFYDNNGNILECIVRYDLKNIAPTPFSSGSFLKISEIGFVVDDVLGFCSRINQKYDIDYFSMQPKSDTFSVMGDNNGLFIISGKNRNWFPTENRAQPFWTKVVFNHCNNRWEMVFDPKSGDRS